ncbi:MAG: c-type cytochrome [Isosphaeraceae bacterium]|nr:c-type cytochrome [Isosphaeraceae bacterium]
MSLVRNPSSRGSAALVCFLLLAQSPKAAEPVPHGQSEPPNPPRSPAEAVQRMKLPEGFHAEVVASEPDIVNPVAMTFDELGRIWITESLEYPRRAPGPGRDRIKVLEDTDNDGKADRFTVFAQGLNIPSGIAVGHGGVWVANSPDILYLQDTDGDGKADKKEVVVTGFGRADTHELPNSLTWGPDGWLYGWNGVFNPSHVVHRGKTYDFTCAIFRIHPKSRDFELFCEGTSNPWGIAWNTDGEAFASACVIDHLWHLTETGYYHRQGGPYPPHTWKIESIVDHKHQRAAYCGIHFFDSDAYPPPYRERLYMGNIHGNSINVDTLKRNGSTYRGATAPDFLTANDAWFMPVSQKTGPDGSLYVLDWYDRYHCYQDANRDPAGIDRLKGRLYRIRYRETPRAPQVDFRPTTGPSLARLLNNTNIYIRETFQRVLTENLQREPGILRPELEQFVLDESQSRKGRMHALWALVGGGPLDRDFHLKVLEHADPGFRAWGVRAAGNMRRVDERVRDRVVALAHDADPAVSLQVAIAVNKIEGAEPIPVWLDILSHCGDDPLIPHIVWQNLHPMLDERGEAFADLVSQKRAGRSAALAELLPRAVERLLGGRKVGLVAAVKLLNTMIQAQGAEMREASQRALRAVAGAAQSDQLSEADVQALRNALGKTSAAVLKEPSHPLYVDLAVLAASWRDPAAIEVLRRIFQSVQEPFELRLRALSALIAAEDDQLLSPVGEALALRHTSPEFRGQVLTSLGRLEDPRVASVVLENYANLEADLQPRAIELLTQRTPWSLALVKAITEGKVPQSAVNLNQVRKLLAGKDATLVEQVKKQWGTVREGRNPQREQVIAQMHDLLRKRPGNPATGRQVFNRVCGQCHKLFGEGQDVGPDLTGNGRASFEQLLSNVFDPSLVIGSAYQATTVATADGRVLTGLLVEDNDQRVILKGQGGKLETVARRDVEALKVSALSLMPEDLEKQLKPEELADLFAFLTLDKPPSDPGARPIPGAEVLPRK